jgi:hypothetical protein
LREFSQAKCMARQKIVTAAVNSHGSNLLNRGTKPAFLPYSN